jgi:hypothetical protein
MLASTRVLLEHVLDYAGTFPPAGLPLADAIGTYARARTSREGWILGRLIVPAGGLSDFERLAPETPPTLLPGEGHRSWPLSAILGTPFTEQLDEVLAFNERANTPARIVSVEFPPIHASEIRRLAPRLSETLEMFFETPIDADLESRIAAIAAVGASAKVRTGGVTAGVFPTPDALARFLGCSAEAGIAFKATAGLHHVVRGCYPLTYEPASPTETMHGFLNLSIAAALARATADRSIVAATLAEFSSDAFRFSPEGVVWKDRFISLEDLAATRRQFFRSFGSCAIREPIDELARIGLL